MTQGLFMARVRDADDLLSLARAARELGFETADAHSPHVIEGMDAALGLRASPVRPAMLVAGLVGAAAIFALQWWNSVYGYPINSGGRPLNSWPAYLFATFETGIAAAAIAGFVTMLWKSALPRPHHPIFEAREAAAITDDGFFLTVDMNDRQARYRAVELLRARPEVIAAEVVE
ncbi:hypothetical protein OCGS_1447 [Oceaniovalibus guishaninsula JLT2003]|uniref:DUF3341 domain-containing protein n=1 Tax=Oceaniovalibus guishaninsula JLT2003 TaxID=1231392 RepID=K2HP26_9RHOB|nr:DUF3341 domain-containing protein [Oceaniovalibus guishaninsula]EKE44609.1 hypothetical protein OCGS_1447 [Oceaniovalibus guishaninsula JLT2003]